MCCSLWDSEISWDLDQVWSSCTKFIQVVFVNASCPTICASMCMCVSGVFAKWWSALGIRRPFKFFQLVIDFDIKSWEASVNIKTSNTCPKRERERDGRMRSSAKWGAGSLAVLCIRRAMSKCSTCPTCHNSTEKMLPVKLWSYLIIEIFELPRRSESFRIHSWSLTIPIFTLYIFL